MTEFKIKVSVELDSSDIEGKLKALGENQKIKLEIDASDLNKVESQLKSLKNTFKDAFKIDGSAISDIKKLTNALDNITGGSSGGTTKTKVSAIVNEYKDLYNTVEKLQKQLNKGGLGDDSITRTKNQISELKKEMSALYNQMSESQKKSIELFDAKQMNKAIVDMNNYMNKIESTATSLGTKLNSISFDHIDTDKIQKLQTELEEIQNIAKQDIDIDLDLDVGDILSDLERISSEIKNLEKVENLASSFDKISSSIKDSSGDIEKFSSEIKDLENLASNLDGSFDKAFSSANSELKEMKSNISSVKSESSGLFGTWDDFAGNFTQFKVFDLVGDFIAEGVRNLASGFKDTIVETDAAITDLKKVYDGNLTGDSLRDYLLEVTEVAKGTGQTSIDVIQGTAKAVQSGISDIDDALTFARQSAIFANVGDVDQGTADTILASVMSAYGGIENALKPVREQVRGMSSDYNTLTKFMDLANYAGNNFAISTADVGEALQLSAAALQTNGVSMEESIGMIVAMNEITQNASKTGNALKTISANMAGVAVSAKDGTLQTNKTAKALKEIADIDVWDQQTGQVKDMYQVMDELNGKWGELTEAEQNALATTIAGKNIYILRTNQ